MRCGASALVSLLALQIVLGAAIIRTLRDPAVTTGHVLVGALTLATTFWLTWRAHRDALEGRRRMTEAPSRERARSRIIRADQAAAEPAVRPHRARRLLRGAARAGWRGGLPRLGTSLAAGGVAALNQWMESDTDAR